MVVWILNAFIFKYIHIFRVGELDTLKMRNQITCSHVMVVSWSQTLHLVIMDPAIKHKALSHQSLS